MSQNCCFGWPHSGTVVERAAGRVVCSYLRHGTGPKSLRRLTGHSHGERLVCPSRDVLSRPTCSMPEVLRRITVSSAPFHPQVFQEVQKLKKQKRVLKAKAAAARKQGQKIPESPSKAGPEAIKENQ